MIPKATKSSFGSVYFRLVIIATSVVMGFFGLSQYFVAPQLVNSRAESILSLIRSHKDDIFLNKTRSLRDELLKNSTIQEDAQFHHYFSEERAKINGILARCDFISPSICLGKKSSVFLEANSSAPPRENFKFAVVLDTDLSNPPALLYLVETLLALIVILAFWLLYKAISKKEKYLLDRLSMATNAFQEVKELFSENRSSGDEFDALGNSVEELVQAFKESKQLITDYKGKFERKTRLEQLGLTVGQVSHDLKAPLNEAENFLASLPKLIRKVPLEEIDAATESLIFRIRSGKSALNQALQNTKQFTVAREALGLKDVLLSIADRAKASEKLQALSFNFILDNGYKTLGDRLRLETAILNLLENTAEEKRDAHVQMTLTESEPGHAKITYQDDGGGIPEEFLEKVFEPLVTYKSTGSGLGLSSTKEILAQHGGRIRALPNRGGAKFEIVLPVVGGANA